MKTHVNNKGEIKPCKASDGNCRFDKNSKKPNKNTSLKNKANYVYNEKNPNIPGSGARQGHGIVFEDFIINRLNLYKPNEHSHTHNFDCFNSRENMIPVSIKNNSLGSNYGMGDIFRQSNIESNFILVSGEWKESINRKNPEVINYFHMNDLKIWKEYFNEDLLEEYRNLLKDITNNEEDDERWIKEVRFLRNKWYKLFDDKPLIKPAPKRDHKNQKRIQCVVDKEIFSNLFVKIEENEIKQIKLKE